ncbi:hypothetical protein IV203_033314 [Nitzschia inconspicua]|uniref:Uncharacterized protein n=1 Tax=Nitzschia inconspicua TaxID=303405 RepID=A0A9K3KMW8_9STRA|nr:hypothetical protein IV203_033314 [Nitzschia inconspicua]
MGFSPLPFSTTTLSHPSSSSSSLSDRWMDSDRWILSGPRSMTALSAVNKKSQQKQKQSRPPPNVPNMADFEYQELSIQLKAMKEQDVRYTQLQADKRLELEGYITRIVERRPSIVPMNRLAEVLPQTSWHLAFSTEPIMNDALPKDATITLDFVNEEQVNYALEFAKTLGLKKLTAQSSFQVDKATGGVNIQYQTITTDVFGLKNLGVGAFGLLQGRGTNIATAYFDGRMWIEQCTDKNIGSNNSYYYNVYVRNEQVDSNQKN